MVDLHFNKKTLPNAKKSAFSYLIIALLTKNYKLEYIKDPEGKMFHILSAMRPAVVIDILLPNSDSSGGLMDGLCSVYKRCIASLIIPEDIINYPEGSKGERFFNYLDGIFVPIHLKQNERYGEIREMLMILRDNLYKTKFLVSSKMQLDVQNYSERKKFTSVPNPRLKSRSNVSYDFDQSKSIHK